MDNTVLPTLAYNPLPASTYNPLPASTYNPQARTTVASKHNTIIEDEPQEYWMSQNDYTPRQATFDDLYDVSDNESVSEDIPIVISLSPIQTRDGGKQMPLEILSPTAWPSVHRPQKPGEYQQFDSGLLSPPIAVPRMKLSLITNRNSMHSSNAPSLDGSLTSEEMATISCPSTPDISSVEQDPSEWTLPVQLQASSMMTLGCLSEPNTRDTQAFALQPVEMQEVVGQLGRLNTQFEICMTPIEDGELSAISIPSPGGFFSTLDADSRSAWMAPSAISPALPTAVAETFYGVPFGSPKMDSQASHYSGMSATPGFRPANIEIYADTELTEGPPTARQIPAHWNCGTPGLQALKSPAFNPGTPGLRTPGLRTPGLPQYGLKSPNFTEELLDFNDNYERQLRESSIMNIDRTASWLTSQGPVPAEVIVEEIPEYEPFVEMESYPDEPTQTYEQERAYVHVEEPVEEELPKDTLILRGFQHVQTTKSDADAFVHRKTRTEKLRLDRKCLFTSHVNQLEGKYIIGTPQPVTAIKRFDLDPVQEEEAEKAMIADAVREQNALQQLEPSAWNVEATKYLNGGTLLTSPTAKIFSRKRTAKILDLGGLSTCDWSWQVAIEHPQAIVQTVYTADYPIDKSIATPTNHKQKVVPNLWTLPFENNYFDCISARNVYSLLKLNKPEGRRSDEYDLCLRECMRVLRPGGYLEFALLDADIMNSGPRAAALNVLFETNLKTHGYDATPTKSWLNRLRKNGFENIRRAWLVLPMSQHNSSRGGTTADASHITGMVGSWAWERWMVKLQREMGTNEERLLEGVVAVLEEGARTEASWRCLSGWARKPY
jgi:SAM-dependent methyltransferase